MSIPLPPTVLVIILEVAMLCCKDEIKFLYKKKDHLNKELLRAHLHAAQEWGNLWPTISEYLYNSINDFIDKKYNNLKQKLKNLERTNTDTPKSQHSFYPRVINITNIQFTPAELTLLNKGLKYKLFFKHKNWVKTLALETETAISQLPRQDQDHTRALAAQTCRKYSNYNPITPNVTPPKPYTNFTL
jgi:hypothetical protein